MNKVTEAEVQKALKELTKALEVGMYGFDTPYHKLINLLVKLGIKNAQYGQYGQLTFGAALEVESLATVLKQVKFP